MSILETIDTPVGSYAPDFELPGIDNQVHHLSRYLESLRSVGVISMCNHCPYVVWYLDRLKQIQAEFSPSGFTLIGVNGSNAHDHPGSSVDGMKAFAQRYELNFPYLWDSTQDVTRSFGAIATPTAFLIDHQGILRYKGQIDNHPHDAAAVGEDYLRNAIVSLFQDQIPPQPQTEQFGTALVWRK
jgi:peroxiredoxin